MLNFSKDAVLDREDDEIKNKTSTVGLIQRHLRTQAKMSSFGRSPMTRASGRATQ